MLRILILALLSVCAASPQEITIRGIVTDHCGVTIKARVTLKDGVKVVAASTTNPDGRFVFRLKPGDYTITVEARTAKTLEQRIEARDDMHPLILRLQYDFDWCHSAPPVDTLAVSASGQLDLKPIDVPICELARDLEGYNGLMIRIRTRVDIGFEEFSFSIAQCAGRKLDAVWLEYGRGPKTQPTTWCCSDLIPRDPSVEIIQDDNFRTFDEHMRAHKRVTATIVGRLDFTRNHWFYFGHKGLFPACLVIRSLADISPVSNAQ